MLFMNYVGPNTDNTAAVRDGDWLSVRDMGYVDADGNVRPPFVWDEDRRLRLRAKLDAVFFHLYGITDRDDVRYIYSTFPIVERQETEAHCRYLSRDLCLAYINALAAGQADAEPVV
jgi:hypothetical protein